MPRRGIVEWKKASWGSASLVGSTFGQTVFTRMTSPSGDVRVLMSPAVVVRRGRLGDVVGGRDTLYATKSLALEG